ncbi:hypothetical protein [Chryseobacterium sp. JK1]|uniref:hypothetical protein n=1 Tax=Chryseobacterium sp. JK1 TaxID=874294 RepID=UPI003D681A0B
MPTVYLAIIFIVAVFGGIAYLIMRFFDRWTQGKRYEVLFNTLIFIVSFFLISSFSIYIFFANVNFGR